MHAAKHWSDPEGLVTIFVAQERRLQKYRFALRTADFYICRVCGAYLGAAFSVDQSTWSTLNLQLTELLVDGRAWNFDAAEGKRGRVARHRRVWTPTMIVTRDE